MVKLSIASIILLTFLGCVSIDITKVSGINRGEEICIVKNFEVKDDFLVAYKASLEKHGYIATIKNKSDHDCVLTTTYTAQFGNHWGVYLARADLKIFNNKILVGRAQYRAPRSDMSKHGRVAGKIDNLVKEMFSQE